MIECERFWTNPQKMQHKTATNILKYGECLCLQHWKHLYSWERITWRIHIPSKIQGKDLTMKQMFDISEKLIAEQSDEIYGVNTINWSASSWKHLSLFGDEEVISPSHARVYVFSDYVLCLGEMSENPLSKILSGRTSWRGSKVHHNTELSTQLMVSHWNSSGIFSQDSPHCSSSTKSKSSWRKCANQNNSKDGSSSCRCSTTSHGDPKTMNRNAN